MTPIRLSLLQVAFDPAPDAMTNKYRAMVAEAAHAGARIVVLPELSLSAYFPGKSKAADENSGPVPENIPAGDTCRFFSALARENGVFLVASLFERGGLGFRKQKGARFNTAVLFDPEGNLGAACRKQHPLAGDGQYDQEYFDPGNSDYPVFALPEINAAIPTGGDLWFPELARILALKGAALIAAPVANASEPVGAGSDGQDAWRTMLRSHAIANGVFVATANRVGVEHDQTFRGGSVIVAPDGTVLAQGAPDREEIVTAEIDVARIEEQRTLLPLLLRREPETYATILGRLSINRTSEDAENGV